MNKKKLSRKSRIFYSFVIFVLLFLTVINILANQLERPYRMSEVLDGDTVKFIGGKTIRLLGVSTIDKGSENSSMSAVYLRAILDNKNVWLENVTKDNQGKEYAQLWVGCESTPKLMASDLLRVKGNPLGCKDGVLVNEQIVKMGWSK